MSDKFTILNSGLYAYVVEHCSPRDRVLKRLAEENERLGVYSLMQIAPEQGALLTLLTRAIGARAAVEVGTFTGYSALCIAQGLGPDGYLLCCDVNEEWTGIARRYWEEAGVAGQIELRLGPALDTLRGLPAQTQFDLGFIDADKQNYRDYYEEILARLRPNGLILFDNVFLMHTGGVADPTATDEATQTMRQLNDFLAADERVETVMLAVADGLTIVRKRAPGERA
ncbi:MAG: methyltransferase domain protein [Deltaproteobacteria bacterium]|nr:methyltransferase domain protein [Deltaproteobacteria bacterium]